MPVVSKRQVQAHLPTMRRWSKEDSLSETSESSGEGFIMHVTYTLESDEGYFHEKFDINDITIYFKIEGWIL